MVIVSLAEAKKGLDLKITLDMIIKLANTEILCQLPGSLTVWISKAKVSSQASSETFHEAKILTHHLMSTTLPIKVCMTVLLSQPTALQL